MVVASCGAACQRQRGGGTERWGRTGHAHRSFAGQQVFHGLCLPEVSPFIRRDAFYLQCVAWRRQRSYPQREEVVTCWLCTAVPSGWCLAFYRGLGGNHRIDPAPTQQLPPRTIYGKQHQSRRLSIPRRALAGLRPYCCYLATEDRSADGCSTRCALKVVLQDYPSRQAFLASAHQCSAESQKRWILAESFLGRFPCCCCSPMAEYNWSTVQHEVMYCSSARLQNQGAIGTARTCDASCTFASSATRPSLQYGQTMCLLLKSSFLRELYFIFTTSTRSSESSLLMMWLHACFYNSR